MYHFISGALLAALYAVVGFGLQDWEFYVLLIGVPVITRLPEALT